VIRRYAPMKASAGTQWPADVKARIYELDGGCVGPRIGMLGECFGTPYPDHVRASGALSMKSRSTVDNGALLCSPHHRLKTENGRTWRPPLLRWIELRADKHAECVDPCGLDCRARIAPL
jgi:hypothetical protein